MNREPAPPGLAARRVMTHRQTIAVTIGVMVTLFLAALESTVVSTAMPTIVASLGGLPLYSWVFSAFFLTSTVSMPLWGRLSDLRGRRRTYLAGIALFLLGSMFCGAATSMGQLVCARALQGLGTGGLVPISLTIVGEIYGLARRARMQAYFSGIWGLASILGPLVGGMITDYVSWRWVFFVNLPIGIIAMLIIVRSFEEDPRPHEKESLDLGAAATFTLGLGCLLFALLEGGDRWGWTDPPSLALFAAFGVLLALFVRQESRSGNALLPFRLLRDRIVASGVMNGFFVGMAMFGAMAFIPLFVQGVLGTTATGAGKVLIPFTLCWVLSATIGARLMLRIGARTPILSGMVLLIIGFFFLTRVHSGVRPAEVAAYLAVAGFGMGFVFATFLVAVQTRVQTRDLGVTTSLLMFMRFTGATLGVAIMGTLVRAGMSKRISPEDFARAARNAGIAGSQVKAILEDPGLLVNPMTRQTFPPVMLDMFREALAGAIRPAFVAGLAAAIMGLVAALFFPAAASHLAGSAFGGHALREDEPSRGSPHDRPR